MISQSTLIRLITHKYMIAIIPIVIFSSLMSITMSKVPMWMDEYVFYRITSQLPSTATTTDWFYIDNPKTLYNSEQWPDTIDREAILSKTYNLPVYRHIPLANYLVYPIVRGVNFLADKGIIPHIENTDAASPAEPMTIILRIIPTVLFMASMWLIFKLLYHKMGRTAYLFFVPVIPSIQLLGGLSYFYWDAFMWFFFFLTLYLMETRPNSKWVYVTACCLVNTKLVIGMLLLIPLIIKKRKIILASLSFLPFYLAGAIITGAPFWLITEFWGQSISVYAGNFYIFWTPLMIKNFGLIYYGIMTLPILYYVKRHPVYVVAWCIIIFYAWGYGIAPDKIASMLYAGALVFPLIMYELGIVNKLTKLAKEAVVA